MITLRELLEQLNKIVEENPYALDMNITLAGQEYTAAYAEITHRMECYEEFVIDIF